MPKVSIIVPIFNVEKYLKECLDSLVNQTLNDIEIICVNDGSTDSSKEIIESYAQMDNRIIAIHKENSGYGASMNCGLQHASGEYIGIVESDDFAELDMFEKLYSVAKAMDVDVVKSNYYAYWSKPEIKNKKVVSLNKVIYNQVFVPIEQKESFFASPIWSAIYKRSFLEQNGIYFNETPGASYQDTAFNFKVWACAESAYLVPEAYLHYRQDNEQSSVKSKAKVYCVCDEYESIEKFLRERPEKYKKLVKIKNRMKYDTYFWNLERLDYSFKLQFLNRISEEFRLDQENSELDKNLYNYFQWRRLQQIIVSPEKYLKQNYNKKREQLKIEESQQNFDNVIKKGIYHFKTKGLTRTIEKIFEKFFF